MAGKVVKIIAEKNFPSVNNFYRQSQNNRENLAKYLEALNCMKPKIMFVGEALGIHGCALTGIPFTSERIIRQGRLERHFPGFCFQVEGNTYEGSAGYFWEMIDQMPQPPVLWNVFPLHPFRMENGVMKNRTPKKAEKEWGREVLLKVVGLFPEARIVSVGNHAKESCERLGVETAGHLIHPAYHANEFREQFASQLLS